MIDFKCPHCGRILRISEDHIGAEGACRHCGGRILVQVGEPPPALDDWTGMLAEAEIPVPEQGEDVEAPTGPKPTRLETDVSLLQALLAQSRSEVERLARDLEAAKNARIEAEVARDIAEARAKRMEERLVAEAGRNDLTVLATDLERAINQLAQSRAEVDRMAKEIEMERTAKIRAEISGRLLESNLRRLHSDLSPDGGFVADTPDGAPSEMPLRDDGEIAPSVASAEPETPAAPAPAASTPSPQAAAKPAASQPANPTLRLDKIMTPRRKRSPMGTVAVVVMLTLAATIAALWMPRMDQFRADASRYFSDVIGRLGWNMNKESTPQPADASKGDVAPQSAPAPQETAKPVASPDDVRGIVVDAETRAPLMGLSLRITGEATAGAPLVVTTGENGAFAAPSELGYGRFTIQCVDPPPGYCVSIPCSGFREKGVPLAPFEIPLSKPATAPSSPQAVAKSVEVMGKVVTISGEPAPEFQILAGTPGAEPKAVAISDTAGVFSFSCQSGPLTLVATGRGTVKTEPVSIEVPPDGLATPQTLELPPAGRVVVVPQKVPPNTSLAVQTCTISYQGRVLDDPKLMVARPEGLVIPYLLPGVYDIVFSVAGYRSVPLKGIMIDDKGSDREVEIALAPLGR